MNGQLDHETVKPTIKKVVTKGFKHGKKAGSEAHSSVDGGVEETPSEDRLPLRPRREAMLQTFTTCEKNRLLETKTFSFIEKEVLCWTDNFLIPF